ncbi:MAG TPA: MFS transporter, partial [Rugosimonospora sp.]|nr:MFS transporter [Rugosimonospora sp.]
MGHRAAAWRVAFAYLVIMLGTTLPTPLYPLYQSRFGFTDVAVTGLYALYALGVIIALLLFGAWSDQIGRRRMLRTGLVLSALSAGAFVVAVTVPSGGPAALLAGRILSGMSVAFVTGTATAALVDLAPPDRRRRASLVAAAVNTAGLGAGPLLAGVLAQYAREPLKLSFAVDFALVVL